MQAASGSVLDAIKLYGKVALVTGSGAASVKQWRWHWPRRAPKGIQVNALAPGYVSTDNTAALRADPVRYPEILTRIPAGRFGDPNDLRGAVVFLASRASDYMNGSILTVDGGWLGR